MEMLDYMTRMKRNIDCNCPDYTLTCDSERSLTITLDNSTSSSPTQATAASVSLTVPVHARQVPPEVARSMGRGHFDSIDHDRVTLKYTQYIYTMFMNDNII